MKFSLTISPHRLTPETKATTVSYAIEEESMADAVMYAAKMLDGHAAQKSLRVVVERTDV